MIGFGSANAVCVNGYGCTDASTAATVASVTPVGSGDMVIGGWNFTAWWNSLSEIEKIGLLVLPVLIMYVMSGSGRRGRY